ncbi:hypothetical protein JYT22_01270 [Endomicrobium sp. AH-315-J14]|nr:hypothetical protein [Endomicrobium sp. AH-315-J14]
MLTVLLLLSSAFLSSSCSPAYGESFRLEMASAKRAYTAGRYLEAAGSFDKAASVAKRLKDRDEARFMQARMFERARDYASAETSYLRLMADSPKGPRTGRAAFQLAYLQLDHGDAKKGWTMLRQALLRFPDHGAASHAMTIGVRELARSKGEEKARRFLEENQPRFRGTAAEQQAKYERALSLERSGLYVRAREAFITLAHEHPYPKGALTDDALWNASLLDERLGHYELAISDLRELLNDRELADGGSYERPRFPAAQMRIAELYRDRLKDPLRSREEFSHVYERHTTSILADDALWEEMLLTRAAGDPEESCELAERMIETFPDSRYQRCLESLCPNLQLAESKRGCPPYLQQQLADHGR